MTDDIAPYEAYPKCPKCGVCDIAKRTYVPKTRIAPEHLEVTCTCGYMFRVRCADSTSEVTE